MSDADDQSDTDFQGESEVQLGFVESDSNDLFDSSYWIDWDGGTIGGWPVSACFHID